MSIQSYLIKQEYLAAAEDLKQANSEDFQLGFDMGAQWLVDCIKELLDIECQYLLKKSDAELSKNTG